MYKCRRCGKEVTEEELSRPIRCPQCGNRILYKKRPLIIKRIKAR